VSAPQVNPGLRLATKSPGSAETLLQASVFVGAIEQRQGLKIGCVEEVAFRMGFIGHEQLLRLSSRHPSAYGAYLKQVAQGD